jgi:hypothetical protein
VSLDGLKSRIAKAALAVALMDTSALVPFTVETTGSFERQWGYVEDRSKAIALLCSRRSGKTEGTDVKTCKRNTESKGRKVLYIHHTLKLAKRQFYKKVIKKLTAHKVPFERNDSELLIQWANGSMLLCIGCSDIGDVGKARGDDWDEIILDEIQEFNDEVLKELLDETILPTMFDHGGTITAQGTPPDVHAGVWWDIINNPVWSQRVWTLLDNPYITKQNIVDTMALRGFVINFDDPTKNDPIVQREVFGLLAIDPSKLVYIYDAAKNALPVDGKRIDGENDKWCECYAEGRPDPGSDQWRFVLGLDLGLSDCDAICVLGWRMDDPTHKLYECYSWKANHQDVDALSTVLRAAYVKWRPTCLVGDNGGHGASKVLATYAERLGVTFELKPASVPDSVALVNDDYRTGRLQIMPNGILAEESAKVAWDAKRKKFSSAFHSDITEAARYAHHAAVLGGFFNGRAPAPPLKLTEQRAKDAADKQQRQLDPMGLRRGHEGRRWTTG